MRIAIVTDAWYPQVNGVVTTLSRTAGELEALGHQIGFITPQDFRTIPCPSYPSIRLALWPRRRVARRLGALRPEAIHIATEGPLGHAARTWCRERGVPFTTSFHTQFPEYLRLRAPVPVSWSYAYLRRFHGSARRTLVPTASQQQRLRARGFANVEVWSRGVDTALFRPRPKDSGAMPRPLAIYVGRVAVEKNVEAFLRLDLPGSKCVVGDGPALVRLRAAYPQVVFTGFRHGEELARLVAAADVFVFPSRTDTFGLVLLEAMACGVPVAAYPVTGPIDVVQQGHTGFLSEDLREAVLSALTLDGSTCVAYAREHSWRRCSAAFADYLEPITGAPQPAPVC